ncbi:hypothetical protein LTR84_000583 [Exophiala bonariae]|uniref:Zn(2)-C6 fungal-type domain-containing protein n=1 Tax=Exophiala bonariae TaxID=1690606 RepID=A0AAV9NR06_9EURO|nr:hypothetical protein LTR84_000583 [Exophiala bonariae]
MSQAPACDYCRHRKRRCDRETPRCSLCVIKNKECRYTEHMRWVFPDQSSMREETPDLESSSQRSSQPSGDVVEFPGVYFLDRDVFDKSGVTIPVAKFQLDQSILTTFDQASEISSRYFTWIHLWMPIVSKAKWKRITGPLARPNCDVKLLLFAMKVLLWTPPDQVALRNPRHQDYLLLKHHLSRAQDAGVLSLELLQTWILVTIYEYSHAIYPAAYVSIGVCFRYSLALGINKQRRNEMDTASTTSDATEERRRVWWSVVILDRMVSRSSDGPEPRSDDLLPVLDQAWDDGKIDHSGSCPVSAPSSTNMGMLARLAQSAFLLGRVYRWKNHPTGDVDFDRSEKHQLDRALRALLNLTYEEGAVFLMAICPQIALCFSALVLLHSDDPIPRSSLTSHDAISTVDGLYKASVQDDTTAAIQTLIFLRPIATESNANIQLFFRRQPWSIETSSPLLLHWTYLTAVTFLQINNCLRKVQGSSELDAAFLEHTKGFQKEAELGAESMKRKLSLLGKQWLAADTYLKMIEARETGMDD